MLHRTIVVVAALLSIALLAPGARAAGEIRWRSFDAGLQEARRADRPVLVDVYTDWCGWCRRMDRDVYARPEVKDYVARRFVTVRLDAEGSASATYEGHEFTGSSLARRFRVTGYPTTVFLRANGDHLVNVPGYVPADRFLVLLRYVAEGAMDRGEDFETFARRTQAGR